MKSPSPVSHFTANVFRRMFKTMKIIGSYVSPYVRKVLVCMEMKGIDYEVDPITPFFRNDEFRC
jgi:hypothetical protein